MIRVNLKDHAGVLLLRSLHDLEGPWLYELAPCLDLSFSITWMLENIAVNIFIDAGSVCRIGLLFPSSKRVLMSMIGVCLMQKFR